MREVHAYSGEGEEEEGEARYENGGDAMTYGYTIVWHSLHERYETTVNGCATRELAMIEALRMAKDQGWTPPRWWQWWRWGDKDYGA